MAMRPAWVDEALFPYESHFADVGGARVHYIDEGDGPVFLGLHGNPTWSFLYRQLVHGLKDRFRCIALDYPGFGLSTAPVGYGYTIAEHERGRAGVRGAARPARRDADGAGLGGRIGCWVAARDPARFRAFGIGNTRAWPLGGDRSTEWFSKILGSDVPGGLLSSVATSS